MILAYPRDTLLSAVSLMQRSGALVKKPTMPVLGYVRLDGRIAATNLDWMLSYAVPIEHHPEILLPANTLVDLLKRADPKSAILFSFDEDRPPTKIAVVLTIKGRVANFEIQSLQPEDFPPPPRAEWQASPQIWGAEEVGAICRALDAVSQDPTREILHGVFAHLRGNSRGRLVATDGRRLLVSPEFAWMWLAQPAEDADERGFILPAEPAALAKSTDLAIWPWRVSRSNWPDRYVRIEAGPWTITTRICAGRYPNYEQVIPKGERATGWRLTAEEAIEAADIVSSLIYAPGKESLMLSFSAEGAVASGPVGRMKITLPGSVDGPAGSLGVNWRYLREALLHRPILVTIASDREPLVCHHGDGGIEVVMPVRTDGTPTPPPAPAQPANEAEEANVAAEADAAASDDDEDSPTADDASGE